MGQAREGGPSALSARNCHHHGQRKRETQVLVLSLLLLCCVTLRVALTSLSLNLPVALSSRLEAVRLEPC